MKRFILLSTTLLCFLLATSQTKQEADSLITQAIAIIKANSDVDLALNMLKQSEDYYLPACGENSLEMARIWYYESVAYAFKEEFFLGRQASEKAWKIAFDSLGYEAQMAQRIREVYSFCAIQHGNNMEYYDRGNGLFLVFSAPRAANEMPAHGLAINNQRGADILFPAVFTKVEVDSTGCYAYVLDRDHTWLYNVKKQELVHQFPISPGYLDDLIVIINDSVNSVFQLGNYLIDESGNVLDDACGDYSFASIGKDSILVNKIDYEYGGDQYVIHKSRITRYNRLSTIYASKRMSSRTAELRFVGCIGNQQYLLVRDDEGLYGVAEMHHGQIQLIAEAQYDYVEEIDLTDDFFLLKRDANQWILDAVRHRLILINNGDNLNFGSYITDYQGKSWFLARKKAERTFFVNSNGETYEFPLLETLDHDFGDTFFEYFDRYKTTVYTPKTIRHLIKRIIAGNSMYPNSAKQYHYVWNNPVNNAIGYDITWQIENPTDDSSLSQSVRYWISNLLHDEISSIFYLDTDVYESANDNVPDGMYSYYVEQMCRSTTSYNELVDDIKELAMSISKVAQSEYLVTYQCADITDVGGSKGGMMLVYSTFNKETGQLLTLDDIIKPDKLDRVYWLLQNKILTEARACWKGADTVIYSEFPGSIYAPCALMPDGLVFCFQPYDLNRIYTDGIYIAIIPYHDLEGCLNDVAKQPLEFIDKQGYLSSDDIELNAHELHLVENLPGYWFIRQRQVIDSLFAAQQVQDAIMLEKAYCDTLFKMHDNCTNVERSMLRLVDYCSAAGNDTLCSEYASRLLERCKTHLTDYVDGWWDLMLKVSRVFAHSQSSLGNDSIAFKTLQDILSQDDVLYSDDEKCILLAESATYSLNCGDKTLATELANSAISKYDKLQQVNAMNHSLRSDLEVGDILHWLTNDLPVVACRALNDSLIESAYDAALLSKNISLETSIAISQIILASQDTLAINKYKKLLEVKERMNRLLPYSNRPEVESAIQTLSDSIDELDKSMQRLSQGYGDYTRRLRISLDDLTYYLRPGEMAIEFMACERKNDIEYYAALIKGGQNVPSLVYLCRSAELNNYDSVYYHIWQPLEPYMDGTETVFFSPSGELYNMAIESVTLPVSGQIIGEKYAMYRLSSTREVVLCRDPEFIRQAEKAARSAVLYGGLDYDTMEESVNDSVSRGARAVFSLNRQARASISGFDYLPGTKQEVQDIDELLSRQGSYDDVTTYTGGAGTESTFKTLTGHEIDVLHIATHGFYLSPQESGSMMEDASIISAANALISFSDKQLLRSGLLFAGANNALLGDEQVEQGDDGILTSLEIASIDLSRLDLVVLSACETALGDVTNDGVYGLQRGFKKAGAHTLLMSLHAVDDDATQLLMTEFYRNLLAGRSKRESLLRAQRYLREYNQGWYSNPEYWAAFILLDALD
jgi:hypothetical protein